MSDQPFSEKINLAQEALFSGEMNKKGLQELFKSYADVNVTNYRQTAESVTVIYCEGMVDGNQLNEYFNSVIAFLSNRGKAVDTQQDLPPVISIEEVSVLFEKVFSGFLVFFQDGRKHFWAIDIANIPKRTPEESKTETSIKGPKDSFTEELNMNISLIRKRIKSPMLFNEFFSIGSISKTKVSILYLSDKVNHEALNEVRERLNKIETESVLSAGQLEQWVSDRSLSIFPLMDYITRPDFAIESMLRGRFIIAVDGSPMVLIGPANFTELTKSPEDLHFPYYFVLFQRVLRIIGILIAIYLPGFWIAIASVNVDQLPFPLLATVVVSRQGLPFPGALEALFILILFELLREAGLRMPIALGQTISIVGGLIIGDAAIRAGLASPTIIVIIALTAVATYTLVNQSLTGTVTVLRFLILVMATFLGIYGVFIGAFAVLLYLCQLKSFRLDYMEPLVSLRPNEILSALLINPYKTKNFTSSMLNKGKKG
ncbi:spore germination protein [Mesobacillus subterraneus]|uniref:spore germination protein n=1 Tax=Mesobacillus subterraneus TaxID=285983 RepID=UPI00203D0F43|nr:spore germination protein [Mesobacillus subterraneus]MCM3575321.1 spore germination protein [Mesobacillus subterraneus]